MARLALLTLAVLAAGCPGEGGDDDYPIGPGGGGGGPSGPGRDAGTDGGTGDAASDGPRQLTGRVCVVSDLRRLINAAANDCANLGANGLSVTLGGSASAATSDDGTFTIPAQEGTNLQWRVTGLNLIPSFVPLSAAPAPLLPAITDDDYNELLLANGGVSIDPGEGTIVARIIRAGAPVMGATAAIADVAGPQALYDGNNATVWSTTSGTGALGIAWLPESPVGTRTLRVSRGTATPVDVPIAVADGAISFVTIALP